ncbi:MAG: hypothetical protein WD738_17660 [Pirellulales bacterium]
MAKKKTARRSAAKRESTPVESIRHKDKRKNIPTEELRDFVSDDEHAPKTVLYPRDPSLDPQLVWKGKDEQDRKDLAVPVVPIYIQEKIHPQAIIDDVIQHDANWSNRLILGDSLLVMTSLAEKEGLKGKVQTIYIDPNGNKSCATLPAYDHRPRRPGFGPNLRQRPVHRRKPQPPPHDQRRRKAQARRSRPQRSQDADHRPRRLRHDDHRQPPQSGRAKHR